MSIPNLFEDFRTIVAALDAARVPYAICGGIAMSIHARPRATIVPGDPGVLLVDVIEVRPGATERAWQTRINADIALLEAPE